MLAEGGFEDQGQAIVMRKLDLSHLNQVVREIEISTQPKFDPFKATICSLASTNEQVDMGDSSKYPVLLEQLERERVKLMSIPIKNRDVKIYKLKGEDNNSKSWGIQSKVQISSARAMRTPTRMRGFSSNNSRRT